MGKKKTLEEVEQDFLVRGYTLLSDSYLNNKTKLCYSCSEGHTNSMTRSELIQGSHCPTCNIERQKVPLAVIKEAFDSVGYKLYEQPYINSGTKLDYTCNKGHHRSMTWSNFRNGQRCLVCFWESMRLDIGYVREVFLARGYTLVSDTYGNAFSKLDYICPKGHFGSMRFNDFQQKHDCPICAEDSSVSKISQVWLDSLGVPNKLGQYREVWKKIGGRLLKLDGFVEKTNMAYEFLGDYYHGNPTRFNPGEMNKTAGKTFGELFDTTMERLDLIRKEGFNLVYIWEKDFGYIVNKDELVRYKHTCP